MALIPSFRRRRPQAYGDAMRDDIVKRDGGRSTLDRLDDALLIVVAVVAALVVLKVVSAVVGTILFFVKLGVVVLLIAGAVALVNRARR
jgi:hypothetical protein